MNRGDIVNVSRLDDAIVELYGKSVSVQNKSVVSGGDINSAYLLTLSNDSHLFLKENNGSFSKMFEIEAKSLLALMVEDGPKVPTPLAYFDGPNHQYLLMEDLNPHSQTDSYWEKLGRAVAHLHQKKGNAFGFDFNNYIGSTPQVNTWESSWIDFFREQRIGFQLKLACEKGLADEAMRKSTDKLLNKLEERLTEPSFPSMIHGDLWSGNIGTDAQGEPAIFDPACYYGHHEAELAMTELFGRWHAKAYAAYFELFPADTGYQERKELYNLYHMFNHLNLFGLGYKSSVMAILNRFL